MLQILLNAFIMPNPYDRSVDEYWRVRLINIYLILSTGVFGFFSLFNLFIVGLYSNAIADIIALVFIFIIFGYYRQTRRVDITSLLVSLNICLISFTIIVISPKHFGVIYWSIFVPIFSMLLLGRKRGLSYSVIYYTLLIAYLGSVVDKEISAHQFVEFIIISLVLIAVIYYYEFNRLEAYTLIQRAAVEDPLTGLSNRRHFNKVFEDELHRAQRNDFPFVFFIMDIDHFKHFNDTQGHLEGDMALKRVAEVLRHHFRRSGDEVFRLGGEEFGGILSSGSHNDYLGYLEKLRSSIESLAISNVTKTADVITASFGVSITTDAGSVSPVEIYQKTDEALYRAKEKGRNRIEIVLLPE